MTPFKLAMHMLLQSFALYSSAIDDNLIATRIIQTEAQPDDNEYAHYLHRLRSWTQACLLLLYERQAFGQLAIQSIADNIDAWACAELSMLLRA